jgi:hypothetical protein
MRIGRRHAGCSVGGALIVALIGFVLPARTAALFAQAGPAAPGGTAGPSGPPVPIAPPDSSSGTGPPGPAAATPCAAKQLRLLCPDLVMSAASALHVDRTTMPGRVLLRATSSLNNRGSGPLELRAHRTGRHGWAVYQAIFDRSGRTHLFRTTAKLVFKYVPGNRYEYGDVGAFSYWKLEHAAAFELWSINAHGRGVRLVRMGPKADYCLRDLVRSERARISPRTPVYPGCNQNPTSKRIVLGTSVGWSDVYPYMYPEQWIDVTGLRGRFAYVQVADPDTRLI